MTQLLADVRLAFRGLVARPGFTVTAVLTLALCTGITTAIFSVVDGVVLRPLPLPDSRRLITLCERYAGATADWCSVSPPNAADIAERSRTLSAVGIARSWGARLETRDGGVFVDAGIADAGFFTALGVAPLKGRTLRASDLTGGPGRVAVVTYEFWQSRLGGAADVVGRVISLDKAPVTIVGVMPRGFGVPMNDQVQLWRPLHINPRDEQHRQWPGFVAYARLKPGITLAAAQADLDAINASLKRDHFATSAAWWIGARSLQDLVVGEARGTILLFLGAVALVLLIGCANVANLLLVRGAAQRREIALRVALGAKRSDLVSRFLTESLLLAVLGTGLGVVLAMWGIDAFRAYAPAGVPRLDEVHVNVRVLLFAVALAVGTTLVFGLAPALTVTRVDPAPALREGGRGQTTRTGRLGMGLVVFELALAVVLLSGAGLLVRTFSAYASWNPGFERERLLIFSLSASDGSYRSRSDVAALWSRVAHDLRAVPGVTGVGSASGGPLFGGRETAAVLPAGSETGRPEPTARYFDVSPGFFGALGVTMMKGRDFDAHDDPGSTPVAIVNETAARALWPNEDPVGKRLLIGTARAQREVVGVVRDVPSIRPGTAVEPYVYWPQGQDPRWFTYVAVRTSTAAAVALPAIRSTLRRIDPDLSPGDVRTMAERATRALVSPRFNMLLLSVFGLTALALGAIGAYGLLSYLVSQRTQEIGVRFALGARPAQVVGEVIRRGLALAIPGVGLGVVGALAMSGAIGHLVFGVSTRDPLTLAASAATLLLVTIVACAVPARRASRVDPMVALRSE
jgi:putative ABC transport system permease protein